MNLSNLRPIEKAFRDKRYETARRLCLRELARKPANGDAVRMILHDALLELGDFASIHQVLDEINPTTEDERLEITLLHAVDYFKITQSGHYRDSEEAKAGFTGEQFNDKMTGLAEKSFTQAVEMAGTATQRRRITEVLTQVGLGDRVAKWGLPALEDDGVSPREAEIDAFGAITGSIKFTDGSPAMFIKVTLGLRVKWTRADAAREMRDSGNYRPNIRPQEVRTTETDARGSFRFENVPLGKQDYIAALLDPQEYDIPTRFLAQGFEIAAGRETCLDLVLAEWTSAPAREVNSPFATEMEINGLTGRRVFEQFFKNPFHFNFPRQLVRLDLPASTTLDPLRLILLAAPEGPALPIQVSGRELFFFAELPEKTDRVYALYEFEEPVRLPPEEDLALHPQDDGTAIVDTGRARFRVAHGSGHDEMPPLLAVQGVDGVWRGRGRYQFPAGITGSSRETVVLEKGPLVLQWATRCELSNGARYEIRFTAHRGEAYLLAHEFSPAIEGASFDFSLKEFSGGRGFLHWTPEQGFSRHWSTLHARDEDLAWLQESVAWWIPPMGFGYAFTPEGLTEKDYIAVFTRRRGDWIDRKFERLIQGPRNPDGTENRELDWPFCEMVGSTISMITAQTDKSGDAFFRFALFEGERHWGILVSDLDRNEGPFKEISAVQHKTSSPCLQDFKDWHLDEPDQLDRPSLVARRKDLKLIRRRVQSPAYEKFWERVVNAKVNPGASAGVAFAVTGDPTIAWRRKIEIHGVAALRSKMTLLGRDFGDDYSPVGGRPITPWAEDYDLIAASGVFTPEEEREVRSFLLLMGHLFMSPDLMNWRYNSRNANFEADRADVVAACGLVFPGNPDADQMVRHAAELMEKSIDTYSTPGSGKWYENPACYYLHAAKCRLNLAFHLASHGIHDPTTMPRMRDFLRWGILLLTPAFPHDYESLRNGLTDSEFRAAEKVRRIPPIGDHAHLGAWVPEHYATMSKLYRKTDPAFADLLLWAYQSGGSDGGYFGNASLILAAMEEHELTPAPPPVLKGRRLEGFGALFRGNFGRPDEFYLLFKQGPGGYRYHRTEGSIILFADGKPLIYDGGEAGETWRHTTLSFYDVHMPLACGHVERFYSFAGLDFAQGVHPVAIRPGEPIQANDSCHDGLVKTAWERYVEPDPVDVRSVLWIKDEYVILHDDLHLDPSIPSYWHMQVVAQGETGNPHDGYLFQGRFGTDLQVMLPDQKFMEVSCENQVSLEYYLPREKCFAMRHLQLKADKPDHYLAVIRPLPLGRSVLRSRLIRWNGRVRGVLVEGEGIDDTIFLSRDFFTMNHDGVRFAGRYGTVVRRHGKLELSLLAGDTIEVDNVKIESTGPSVFLTLGNGAAQLVGEGSGTVTVTYAGRIHSFEVNGILTVALSPNRG